MKITHLEEYTRQSYPVLTYLLQRLAPLIFTMALPQYFPCCFLLAFLKGRCSFSSLAVIFLHLDSTTWDPSVPSNKAASSSNILSWSYWRYSIVLLFLSFSSITLCLSASSRAFSSAFLLAFWAACSAQCNFATSSSWIRSHCFFLCLHYISCCCFSSILVSFWEMSERVGEDMTIQKQEQKTSLFIYVLLT